MGVRVYNVIGAAIIGAVNAGTSGMTTAINAGLRVAESALSSLTGAVNKWIAFYNKYMPGPNISSIPSVAFPNVTLPTFTFTPAAFAYCARQIMVIQKPGDADDDDYVFDPSDD